MEENLRKIQKLMDAAEGNLTSARNLMRQILEQDPAKPIDVSGKAKDLSVIDEGKIVEGVFNGQNMLGADNKEYPVPANYASKSKLVEGDTLKLTIAEDGSFVYKQIAPIERKKTVGTLAFDAGSYIVEADGRDYRVLPASVTYFKGQPGDQVAIIVPKEHESTWAAVENIIKKNLVDEKANAMKVEKTEPEESKPDDEQKTPEIEFPAQADSKTVDQPDRETKKSKDDKTTDDGIKELEI
jgi:hypothetical protein